MACGNVVRPLWNGSSPRTPCRYSGITNVKPMKPAMANAITRFVARNRRSFSSRSASIGCGWCVSTYTSRAKATRPPMPNRSTSGLVQPMRGPSLRA